MRALVAWLVDPTGERYEVTQYLAADDLGELDDSVEEDLTTLVHGDVTLTLHDDAGSWAELLRSVAAGDVWELIIERATGRRQPLYERVFGGVLDLPGSLIIDHQARTVEVQAFAQTKRLEWASAHQYRRDFTGVTGSVTFGHKNVTVSSSAGLVAGDEITLSSGSTSETQVIERIVSSTQLDTVEAFASSFASAELIVETPYYRLIEAETAARELFGLGGVESATVDIGQRLGVLPFAGLLQTSGAPSGAFASLVDRADKIALYTATRRYEGSNYTSGFADCGADTPKQDWRPYETSEPVTLRACGAYDGERGVRYSTGDYFSVLLVGGVVKLYKNGVFGLDVYSAGGGETIHPSWYGCDVQQSFGAAGEVWVWWVVLTATTLGDGTVQWSQTPLTYRYDTTPSYLGVAPAMGAVRSVADPARMAVSEIAAGPVYEGPTYSPFLRWAASVRFCTQTAVDSLALIGETCSRVWTLRAFGDYYAAITDAREGQDARDVRLVLWVASSGVVATTLPMGALARSFVRATVWENPATNELGYLACVEGIWFLVSREFSGLVGYLDCEDKSVAGALADLAVYCCSVVGVDHYGCGFVLGRESATARARAERELPDPLELRERTRWEWYAPSVLVSGEDAAGAKIEAVAGDVGNDADRLEVSVALPIEQGHAAAIAAQYADLVTRERRQLDVIIDEPADGPLAPLDVVSYDGARYFASRVERDLSAGTQALTLVEEI